MTYKNKFIYNGEMSASDLVDAIVEVRAIDMPEFKEATKLFIQDLNMAILASNTLFYLESKYTHSPYINEHFGVYLFNDMYYAEKFVDARINDGLVIKEFCSEDYEKFFTYFYDTGAECVDFCNDTSSVVMPVDKLFLPDNYVVKNAPGRMLNRFVSICMQEIRNSNRVYEKKNDIVDLLKKNIIMNALSTEILIAINKNNASEHAKQLKMASFQTDENQLIFPIYTSRNEFELNAASDLDVVPVKMIDYLLAIEDVLKKTNALGVVLNPATTGFVMNVDIVSLIIQNSKNN